MKRGEGKRGSYLAIVSFLIFLLLATIVVAKHDATITITPDSAFETLEQEFNITVNNFGSRDEIIQLTLGGDLTVTNVTDIPGWSYVITNDGGVRWENGSIEGNVVNALFQLRAKMNTVASNQTKNITLISKDIKDKEQTHNKQVTVVNDDLPPTMNDYDPAKASFISPIATKNVSVTALDNQTGIANVTFSYDACIANNAIATQAITIAALTQQGSTDSYAKLIDFSGFGDGTSVCYTFTATDNGGGVTTFTSNVTIDGTAPTVTLTSPVNGGNITASDSFSFNFTDVAPNGTCTLVTNATNITTLTATTGANNILAENATDGKHTWSVSCTDLSGNTGTSENRTYTLDKSGPAIALVNAPAYLIRGSDHTLTANITDLTAVDQVSVTRTSAILGTTAQNITQTGDLHSLTVPTAINTTPENYTFSYTSNDTLGQLSNATFVIPVVYGYTISFDTNEVQITTGNDGSISGKVTFDNGSLVPESQLTLYFPSGSALVTIDNTSGTFSYTYPGPNSSGNFNVTANVTAENGVTFSKNSGLVVSNPTGAGVDEGGSGGSGSSGSGSSRGGSSSSGSSSGSSAGAGGAGAGSSGAGSAGSAGSSGSSAGSSGAGSSGASTGSSAGSSSAGSSGSSGVGRATGFVGDSPFKYGKLLWSLLIIIIIVGSLLYVSREDGFKIALGKKKKHGKEKHKTSAHLSLEEYLKGRLK